MYGGFQIVEQCLAASSTSSCGPRVAALGGMSANKSRICRSASSSTRSEFANTGSASELLRVLSRSSPCESFLRATLLGDFGAESDALSHTPFAQADSQVTG